MIDALQSASFIIAVVALILAGIFQHMRIRRLEQRVSELTRSRRTADMAAREGWTPDA